ncbi:MAG: phage baseplate assembly protein V [Burkholderiales bacterium]|nr:phage baseplate assembly protein V [Burkholderiales bacterium]
MEPRQLTKLLGPMARRMRLAVGRAVVTLVNDALKLQGVQVALLADEVRDNVERFQQYGLTSHPHPGAEAIVVSVGGNRNHPVVICVDDRRYRLKSLAPGEVALYSDEGDWVWFKRGRTIEVNTATLQVTASTKVRMETPVLEVTGEIKDRCDADGTSMEQMRTTYDSHTHGGVQPGGSNTATPNQVMG